jgi:hypothetical protein
LVRSDDRCDSCSLVTGLWDRPERPKRFGAGYDNPGIHGVLVDPRDPPRVGVIDSCGGYWASGDDWMPMAVRFRPVLAVRFV